MKKQFVDKIHLKDFDLFGMFELEDVEGIEALVTPIGNGKYISRGVEYYKRRTCEEASELRELLKSTLPYVEGKKAFVLLDHMANLSGKVYFSEVVKAVKTKDYSGIDEAKQCLYDDISNVIKMFEGKEIEISKNKLPKSEQLVEERSIECENLALLYIFTNCFKVPKGYNVLNAGLGGIYIGPFFKAIHGVDWTNIYKSKYVDDTVNEKYDFFDSIVDLSVFKNKKVLFLDDNMGTGDTTREIVTEFRIKEFDIKYGAVQYNWLNFYRVGAGEKDIKRFNPFEIDYLTPYNYPGHKLIKHAIAMLCGYRDIDGNQPRIDTQTPPGMNYNSYLRDFKHYKIDDVPGIITVLEKGVRFSSQAGINLLGNRGMVNKYFRPETKELINNIDKYCNALLEINTVEEINKKIKGSGNQKNFLE